MRHPRDRANATGDARIVSRVFSNPRAGCSKSNLTFQGVEREPDACFNSLYTSGECCLGTCRAPRGRCVGGVCECHASFAGFDCSDHPAAGHPAGFIYVHAPPPKLGMLKPPAGGAFAGAAGGASSDLPPKLGKLKPPAFLAGGGGGGGGRPARAQPVDRRRHTLLRSRLGGGVVGEYRCRQVRVVGASRA